jgi:hypothetical protein
MESADYIEIHQEFSKMLKQRLLRVGFSRRKTMRYGRGTSMDEVRYLCKLHQLNF